MTIFDQPGKTMNIQSYQVFQVIEGGHALANSAISDNVNLFIGPTVLVYGNDKTHYYDDLVLRAGNNQIYKQVGIYHYTTKNGDANGIVPFIISDDLKMFYYRGLEEWGRENGYLTDTCLTVQEEYKSLLDYFRIRY